MNYIGIDLGTSSVKLLLTAPDGRVLITASRSYPCSFPHPGWSEQDPDLWIEATWDALKELLADTDKSQIGGIATAGQMHGLVALDDQDRPIRPAILWNDGRTVKEVDYLNNVIGRKVLSARTANIAFAGFTAPKILWMRENEPENYARIRRIMLPKDYITYKLSGVFATDYSDASGTLLLDVEHKDWSDDMLALCGLDRSQVPALYESYQAVGTILPKVAEEFGLPAGVKIVAGCGDNAGAAIGTNTVKDGTMNLSLGTSGTLFIASDTFKVDPTNALHSFDHASGRYHLMGCMLSAASCNMWWYETVLKTKDYGKETQGLTQDRMGRGHVYFLPYLMGERSPLNDAAARACFIGMTMDTSRLDMAQAVLEGVSFALRDSLEVARSQGIKVTHSCLVGGGAKSQVWQQMLANILNLRLDLPAVPEGPGFGAAILAMVADGVYPTVDQAAQALFSLRGSVEPDPEVVKRYDEQYQKFRLLYPALKEVFPKLG